MSSITETTSSAMPNENTKTASCAEILPSSTENPYDNTRYRNYVLFMLTMAYAFNFIDRQILVILQESIKQELLLSDAQLGLLTGIAFAFFYVMMGIPVARLADKWVRRNIMSIAISTWSFFTAISGFAQNYTQLLLARIGVGVGESGCSPPAHSMISDMYPAEKRGTALSIYSLGINIGVLFGFLLGGWINEFFGWRVAFIVVGVPGILIGILIQTTIKEPIRGARDAIEKVEDAVSFKESIKTLWSKKSFRHISLGASCLALIAYGSAIWFAPYTLRNFDIQTGELGTWLALISGILGGAGTLYGGYLADKKGVQDKRWYIWIPAVSAAIALPFLFLVYMLDELYLVLCLFAIPATMATVYMGPSLAMVQGLVNVRMRALASAILFFAINILGLGLGPVLVGIISDQLSADFGTRSVGYAVLGVSVVFSIIAIWQFLAAGKYINEEMESAKG
ncbi:MFS transporter [Oleiphilus sp. HI0125]|uniref:spinster family MFS transporter n=1 Tax=Oleiphilus sp. HI0125 TaxID=1822266 RepID=UPI0018D3FDDE|nr:MFS transporter [Oleiphilus sp. HI0125]